VLVHGPYKSSFNTGKLGEKGSSNEPAGEGSCGKALKNAGCAQSTANVIYSIFWHRASARA